MGYPFPTSLLQRYSDDMRLCTHVPRQLSVTLPVSNQCMNLSLLNSQPES